MTAAIDDLRRALRELAASLELACRTRCAQRGQDDSCHRDAGCRNRRVRDDRPVCVADAVERAR